MTDPTSARDRSSLRLDDFLEPLGKETFLADYWEEKYLLLKRRPPAFYDRLFASRDVDAYLSLAARDASSWLSVCRADRPVERRRASGVSPSALYNAFHGGSTLLFEGVDRVWPPLHELAAMLRRELSARVQINVYMTPPGFQGAHIHCDIQDVFAVQLQGAKEWYLYRERVHEPVAGLTHIRHLADPAQQQAFERGIEPELAEQTRLEEGDLLYIPRGVVHRAVAPPDCVSLHLAICVTPVYWVEVLKAAVEVASASHPEMSRALPPGFERRRPAELAETLRDVFRRLLATVDDPAGLERTLAILAKDQILSAPPPAGEHFAQLHELDAIGPETWVERRPGQASLVETRNGKAAIYATTGQMSGPAAIAPALEHVRDEPRFRVRDLPGALSEKSKLTLVRRLIREGLLRIATTERSPS